MLFAGKKKKKKACVPHGGAPRFGRNGTDICMLALLSWVVESPLLSFFVEFQ